eukprot:7647120-Pyramimonas_sp.AAC.1
MLAWKRKLTHRGGQFKLPRLVSELQCACQCAFEDSRATPAGEAHRPRAGGGGAAPMPAIMTQQRWPTGACWSRGRRPRDPRGGPGSPLARRCP